MGSHGHLELILKDGVVKKAEVYHDGPSYVVEALQKLAIEVGRKNCPISDLNLQGWFDDFARRTESNVTYSYESSCADYCRINQGEGKIEVDSRFVYDSDEVSRNKRRFKIDLQNPHNNSGFNYDPLSLKAALKILGYRSAVFWKDSEDSSKYYSDKIDSSVPFRVKADEFLLVESFREKAVLFRFDGENFNEIQYNR